MTKALSFALLLLSAPFIAMESVPEKSKTHEDPLSIAQLQLDGIQVFIGDETATRSKTPELVPLPAAAGNQQLATCPLQELSLVETEGYESDTEKGLDKENIQLYRFCKMTNAATDTLREAHPYLVAWLNNPEETKGLQKFSELSKKLEIQSNRIHVWKRQIRPSLYEGTAAYTKLGYSIKAMGKSLQSLSEQNQEKLKKRLASDLSYPVSDFLMTFETLEKTMQ